MQASSTQEANSAEDNGGPRSAARGDFVFVQMGERRALGIVDSFDGRRYVVRPCVPGSLPTGPQGTLDLVVAPPYDTPDDTGCAWSNAPTPTCCVCLEDGNNSTGDGNNSEVERERQRQLGGRRMAALACRCSAPSVCVACARALTACPQCRAPLRALHMGVIPVARLEAPIDRLDAIRLAMVSLGGKRHPVVASPSWSVRTLKACYAHAAGAHPKQQTLKYAGATLNDDDRNLASYALCDGGNIHVILNLGGD